MKQINKHLQEAIGYLIVSVVLFVLTTNPMFQLITLLFRAGIFILAGILLWMVFAKIFDYFRKNKELKGEDNNCPKD